MLRPAGSDQRAKMLRLWPPGSAGGRERRRGAGRRPEPASPAHPKRASTGPRCAPPPRRAGVGQSGAQSGGCGDPDWETRWTASAVSRPALGPCFILLPRSCAPFLGLGLRPSPTVVPARSHSTAFGVGWGPEVSLPHPLGELKTPPQHPASLPNRFPPPAGCPASHPHLLALDQARVHLTHFPLTPWYL